MKRMGTGTFLIFILLSGAALLQGKSGTLVLNSASALVMDQQTGELLFPGGIATICMMPFVGTMLKKGVPGQFMATGGFFLFFVFTWMLSNSTLESGTGDFFWPLVIRGIGMAILFVPLTTLALFWRGGGS